MKGLVVCSIVLALFVVGPGPASGYWHPMNPGTPLWGFCSTIYDGRLIEGGGYGWDGSTSYHYGRWSPQVGMAWALTVWNGRLIAGSNGIDFGHAWSDPQAGGNYLSQWDGTAWASLDAAGIPEVRGWDPTMRKEPRPEHCSSIHALTVYNGDLVASGTSLDSLGNITHYVAELAGDSWSILGLGQGPRAGTLYGAISALAVYDGKLIAAGDFTTIGGVAADGIAQWDGSAWSPLGSGIGGGLMGMHEVWALQVYNGKLVAGGYFSAAGRQPASAIAQWDGSSWSSLGAGLSGNLLGGGAVGSMTLFDAQLAVAGCFDKAGDVAAEDVALWDGSSWSALDPGLESAVPGLQVAFNVQAYGDALYVTGWGDGADGSGTYLARWDNIPPLADEGPGVLMASAAKPSTELGRVVFTEVVTGLVHRVPRVTDDTPAIAMELLAGGRTIRLRLPAPAPTNLQVFTLSGASVRTLASEVMGPGEYHLHFDGRDSHGRQLPTGIYFVKLARPDRSAGGKLCLIR